MCSNEQTREGVCPIVMVAVHLGASNATNSEAHRKIAKMVCEAVMEEAKEKVEQRQTSRIEGKQPVSSAVEAVVRAIELMEQEKSLNCGYGSNLNILGKVECDASLMSSKDQIWAGVGSVAGCKSPIRLAKSLLDQYTIARPLGLIQPNLLVASGARRWMREHCPELIISESCLISSRAIARYQDVKSDYDSAIKNIKTSHLRERGNDCDQVSERDAIDTVGAVAVDCHDNFACAVSSGGIILKHQGRVGQAAVPGAGCWAQDSLAITTTGVGEYLTSTLFARSLCEKFKTLEMLQRIGHPHSKSSSSQGANRTQSLLISEATSQCFRDFIDSPVLSHVPASQRLAGILAVSSSPTDLSTFGQGVLEDRNESANLKPNLYLTFGHNTKSLCVGYMTASAAEAESVISRNDENDEDGMKHGSALAQQAGITYQTIELVCSRMSSSS